MARPSEYDFLKEYTGVNVIYALYTDAEGIRYIGYSKDVYRRFRNHLTNHESDSNYLKKNWISENKGNVKIKLLSIAPKDWEAEEKKLISTHKNLLNICVGGKNNRIQKLFSQLTDREHLLQINKSLSELNKYYRSKGKNKVFELFSKSDINKITKNGLD